MCVANTKTLTFTGGVDKLSINFINSHISQPLFSLFLLRALCTVRLSGKFSMLLQWRVQVHLSDRRQRYTQIVSQNVLVLFILHIWEMWESENLLWEFIAARNSREE